MKISVLIPCHNEEKSIRSCVESCLNQTRPADEIIVVNDGSTDKSSKILKSFGDKIKVIDLYPCSGNKSYAQENGLKFVNGDIFVTTDGDTKLDKDFIKYIEEDFRDKEVAAVGGYVKSLKYNWLTACRAYDYVICQNIHKLAQSDLNFILVIPGAAGAFRKEIFNNYVGFDHDTITEDLDFTYKLNKSGMKIKYDRKAICHTQDPVDLKSYINQMRRWYGGGFQNLVKHLDQNLVEDPRRALELSLLYIEGIVFSLLIFIVPLINIFWALKLFSSFILVAFILAIYASIREKRADLLTVPFYYLAIVFINSYIFLEQLVKEVFLKKRNLFWFQPERIKI
jgi:peptidoglycan-N-acetylglucosamine deacetylase